MGAKHGNGQFRFTNGDVYDGEFKNNKYHGKGKFTFANGEIYKG